MLVRFFALLGALMGIYAAAALQNGPEQTDAHACQLLRRIIRGVPERCFVGIDDWATVIAVCFVLACVILLLWDFKTSVRTKYAQAVHWCRRPRAQRISLSVEPHLIIIGLVVILIGTAIVGYGSVRRYRSLQTGAPSAEISKVAQDGIFEWKFDSLIPGSVKDGVHYISKFWIEGSHRENGLVQIEEAAIVSRVTGGRLRMKIRTDQGYVWPAEANAIPPAAPIYLDGLLYEPGATDSKGREGLEVSEFLKRWGAFTFELSYSFNGTRATYGRNFDFDTIKHKLAEANPQSLHPPRVTKRQDFVLSPQTLDVRPNYQPEEIGKMLTAFLRLREIIDQMPSASDIDAVKGPWDRIIKSEGPSTMAEKVKVIAEKGLIGINALDHHIEDNKHFSEELYSTILPNREPVLGGFISTSHQLSADLAELSNAQNVDVVKWTKPHYEDWTNFSGKYLEWVSSSNARITAKTKELREWKIR